MAVGETRIYLLEIIYKKNDESPVIHTQSFFCEKSTNSGAQLTWIMNLSHVTDAEIK